MITLDLKSRSLNDAAAESAVRRLIALALELTPSPTEAFLLLVTATGTCAFETSDVLGACSIAIDGLEDAMADFTHDRAEVEALNAGWIRRAAATLAEVKP